MKIPIDMLSMHPDVATALHSGTPVLALESTIIAHGMPYPENLSFAQKAEDVARQAGAVPATIGILNGKIKIGLTEDECEQLASRPSHKTTLRDLAHVISEKASGATTVSATMALAHAAGINVFATGGIGGIHRNVVEHFDISQDMLALSNYPLLVVCAGVKAVLDIPKTLEVLETAGVPVVSYNCSEFPAFYSRSSGLASSLSLMDSEKIADLFWTHRKLGIGTAVLVANPIPKENEIPRQEMSNIIDTAIRESQKRRISGKAVTPFLLQSIVQMTGGRSLGANIALAINNVKVGAELAILLKKRSGSANF